MQITQTYQADVPAAPRFRRPVFSVKVAAGSPLPADNAEQEWMDLNELLVEHPAHTFFVRVQGESMLDAGIFDGDLLVVDRALPARDGSIVLARLNGDFTVKRLRNYEGRMLLLPENRAYPPIEVTQGVDFEVWGIVTNSIHPLR